MADSLDLNVCNDVQFQNKYAFRMRPGSIENIKYTFSALNYTQFVFFKDSNISNVIDGS